MPPTLLDRITFSFAWVYFLGMAYPAVMCLIMWHMHEDLTQTIRPSFFTKHLL